MAFIRHLLFFMLTPLVFIAVSLQSKYTLVWKPVVGDQLNYDVSMRTEMPEEAFTYQTKLKLKVIEVQKSGGYILESSTDKSTLTVGKDEVATENGPARREVFDARGHRIDYDSSLDEDPLNRVLGTICEFLPPPKSIEVGGKWKRNVEGDSKIGRMASLSSYTLKGPITSDWLVDYGYSEKGEKEPVTALGQFVLSGKDFSIRSSSIVIKNVLIDPTAPRATVTMSMVRED
ncbi:hypothetical protein BH11ARM1_BH11ARM1_12200 [soil metagenome]